MKLSLNSINPDVFKVSGDSAAKENERNAIVAAGRTLAYEYARKATNILHEARGLKDNSLIAMISDMEYKELNGKFQQAHLLYAARLADVNIGKKGPIDFEDFKHHGQEYYKNDGFLRVLMGIYQDVLTPILPRVYSEAVGVLADVVEVGFGETYMVSISSNDIPVFQDSAWGASRSVPRNRFYSKDYTLNPQPKTAQINAKWAQLVGTNTDFGKFFANISAGMYAKTMGMWGEALYVAISGGTLIPASLVTTFSNQNWVNLANKLAASNNVPISNLMAVGTLPTLSQVLPTDVTGSTNVNMDAAIATLLGADYTRSGYLGEFMSIRLMPLDDVVIPGTQNTTVDTMFEGNNNIIMMASSGRKPMIIGYNSATPITLEVDPSKSGDMELAINLTTALDILSVFESHIGVVAM